MFIVVHHGSLLLGRPYLNLEEGWEKEVTICVNPLPSLAISGSVKFESVVSDRVLMQVAFLKFRHPL